jgi:2-iminobutanoate/2-iminopropanoate deaminase
MKSILCVPIWLTAPALFVVMGLAGCASAPMKEAVSTKEAPAAIGPYSQGIKVGNLLFLSGQISIDPKTNQMVPGSIEEQTKQALDNLAAVLKAEDMSMENVVNTTVFLKDVNDFGKMNAVYGTFFKDKPPARATVQVARLPRDALVEISAIAVK